MRRLLRDRARVLHQDDLTGIVTDRYGIQGPDGMRELVSAAVDAGLLRRAVEGYHLNLAAAPRPTMAELAGHLVPGAVVSLLTTLGDRVLNNGPRNTWAVVPLDVRGDPNAARPARERPPGRDDYIYQSIDADAFHAPAREDLYDSRFPYPRATAEAALAHWIHIAEFSPDPANPMRPPPIHDVDFTEVDEDRLRRVVSAMGAEAALDRWLERRPACDRGADQNAPGLGF